MPCLEFLSTSLMRSRAACVELVGSGHPPLPLPCARYPAALLVIQPVTEVPLRIDWIVTEPLAKPFPELADVAFDYRLVDAIAEKAVDGVENLRFRNAATFVHDEIFENAPLAPR